MITINLLPQEYRRQERTSFKVFGSLMVAVLVVCCSLGYFGSVYLNDYLAVVNERVIREERLANLIDSANYDDSLVAEKAEFNQRSKTIQDIANSRVLWTRVLDLIIDTINNQGNTERHNSWLRDFSINRASRTGGPVITANAFIESNSWHKQANLLDDFKANTELWQDMMDITKPGGQVIKNEQRQPPEAIQFTLKLQMKAPQDWARNKKKN